MVSQQDKLSFERVVMLAKRWLPFVVLAVIIATMTTFVITNNRPNEYKATSTLLIGLADQLPNRSEAVSAGQGLARTYARTFDDSQMYTQAVQALGLKDVSPNVLQSNVKVFAVRNTQLVDIDVTWRTPEQAIQIANYLAEAFAERRRQAALETLKPSEEYITQQRAALEQQLRNVKPADYDAPQTSILRSGLDMLIEREQMLAMQSFDIRKQINVVSPASTAERVGLSTNYLMLIAALITAAVSIALIIVVELFSTTRLPEDTARQLGFQSFVMLPTLRGHTSYAWRILVDNSASATAQVLRLVAGRVPAEAHYLLVGGIGKRTDAASVTVNLAAAAAESGRRVLLVDANLEAPRLHTLFEMPESAGLNQVLYQGHSLEGALLATPIPGVTLLSTGPQTKQSNAVTDPTQLTSLIASLHDTFDLIIVDLHEPLQHRSASGLVNLSDGLLLVVHEREATEQALHPYSGWVQLKDFAMDPMLVVYNGVPSAKHTPPPTQQVSVLARQA